MSVCVLLPPLSRFTHASADFAARNRGSCTFKHTFEQRLPHACILLRSTPPLRSNRPLRRHSTRQTTHWRHLAPSFTLGPSLPSRLLRLSGDVRCAATVRACRDCAVTVRAPGGLQRLCSDCEAREATTTVRAPGLLQRCAATVRGTWAPRSILTAILTHHLGSGVTRSSLQIWGGGCAGLSLGFH